MESVSQNRWVLVVEDNPQVSKLTVNRLLSIGYLTLVAENGPAAVQILKDRSDIDLVLSEIVMDGGMSGYDVQQWIREYCPQCKVLLSSGYSEHTSDDAAPPILRKPYTLTELHQALDQLLEMPVEDSCID